MMLAIHCSQFTARRLPQCTAARWMGLVLGMAFVATSGRAATLEDQLRPLIDKHQGDVAVAIKHLKTGESYHYRADEPMPTASLIKFPVMVEAYRQAASGLVDLDEKCSLSETDKVPGSGILTPHFSGGTQISLRDAIRLMIVYSDNTATNLVLDRIGLETASTAMQVWEMPHTRIHAKVYRGDTSVAPERSRQFGLGSTTAAETIRLYELLWKKELVSEDACEAMLGHLLACEDRTKLAADLPPDLKIAHKSGAVNRVKTDGGLLLIDKDAIAICVLTANNQDRGYAPDNAGSRLCAEIARTAYDHFVTAGKATGDAEPPRQVTLRQGAGGKLVEILQRTLNARLEDADLSIDGDFGPITENAVRQFQQQTDLAVTGVVEQDTWEALSPLLTRDQPVPPPEEVNQAELESRPPETLDGPPLTTCKAWVIVDRTSGEVVAEHKSDSSLDFASTTKIMTAYLVLRLAEKDPSILHETVTFSHRADETIGSTAGVMAGESLSVHEALHGLLLPSGNDASVALAEHFGARCADLIPLPADRETDPLRLFVAAMNAIATELKMTSTTYQNPHGLTAPDHRSSAADLARLARAAWQLESFRAYVGTRQRGAALAGPGGYTRYVLWKNTNRLLPIRGYQGIKTGTTSAAGACLVSTGERDGDALIVVVLGSASSDARYVDTRNLYRWAWSK